MFLPTKTSEDEDHENQGKILKQQLPSIQEMFGETYSLAFPSGSLCTWPSKPRYPTPAAKPTECVADHSYTEAPSAEQGPLLQVSTIGSPLSNISPINDLQHLEVVHPVNPTLRSVDDSRGLLHRSLGAENASSSPLSSQEVSVSRQPFCQPDMVSSSNSTPKGCYLDETRRFSKHPDLSIPGSGSLPLGPVISAQPSFADTSDVYYEIPTKARACSGNISYQTPPNLQQSRQPGKQNQSSLDLNTSLNLVRDYFSWSNSYKNLIIHLAILA